MRGGGVGYAASSPSSGGIRPAVGRPIAAHVRRRARVNCGSTGPARPEGQRRKRPKLREGPTCPSYTEPSGQPRNREDLRGAGYTEGTEKPMFDSLAIARQLTEAGIDRAHADALADAIRQAAEHGEHVTPDRLDARIATAGRMIAVAGLVVAALRLLG